MLLFKVLKLEIKQLLKTYLAKFLILNRPTIQYKFVRFFFNLISISDTFFFLLIIKVLKLQKLLVIFVLCLHFLTLFFVAGEYPIKKNVIYNHLLIDNASGN